MFFYKKTVDKLCTLYYNIEVQYFFIRYFLQNLSGYAKTRGNMPRFFVKPELIEENFIKIIGDDARHISRSLRMAQGEEITVCDMRGTDYTCVLEEFCETHVGARIVSSGKVESEPPFYAHLFQALPKGEKLDYIIQKAVECGISEITTFNSERCIAKEKANESAKLARRQRISLEAAKQSGRGIVPEVNATVSYQQMLDAASKYDLVLFCYEKATDDSLQALLSKFKEKGIETPKIAIVIGSEGGFSEKEANLAMENGMNIVGLGKRILRTETASSFMLGCLVYEFEL